MKFANGAKRGWKNVAVGGLYRGGAVRRAGDLEAAMEPFTTIAEDLK